jgi:signal transduction histidine kinase
MGPYVALNAVLVGAFGFAAIYHLVLWSQARRDTVLQIFVVHCIICASLSASLIALVLASTPLEGQRALDMRSNLAIVGQITTVWLLSLIGGVRARWFIRFTTVVFLVAVFANVAISPLAGVVTGVERVFMPWGEPVSILHRESPSAWLRPLYAVGATVPLFGFVCAARLWIRDRIGGALLATASAGLLAGTIIGALVDTSGRQGIYVGALPYAVWVILLSIEIARGHRHALEALEASREQLRRLADSLLLAREEERATIARDIHDVLGQTLTALKMDTAWIGRRLPDDVPAARAKLAAMASLIDDTVVTVRRIATDLRPGILDDLGLAAAVEWQAREFESRTGIPCALHASLGDGALDPMASTAVFRILQESLTNVTRHSRATHVAVRLERRNGDLILEVRDDGIGIADSEASNVRSIGLAGMRERAQLVGGGVSITGSRGDGTTIRVQIPWRQEAHA